MNQNQINVSDEFGTDLSSRHCASLLRSRIFDELRDHQGQFVVDLSGIRSVSHSFADELFAVMVAENGVDWFRDHICVRNPTTIVRQTILEAIQDRIGMVSQ